jgi:hypothetical protein
MLFFIEVKFGIPEAARLKTDQGIGCPKKMRFGG